MTGARRRSRAVAPLLGAVGLLALAAACWRSGQRALPPPPAGSPSALVTWIEDLGPIGAAMALLRVATTAAASWLGGGMLVHLTLGALSPTGAGRSLADRVAPASARRAVHLLAGASLGTLAVVTTATPVLGTDPPATATLRALEPAPSPDDGEPAATLRSLDAPTGPHLHIGPDPDADAETEAGARSTDGSRDAAPEIWSVAPGESFWSIATEVLAERWERAPTEREVTPYWRALVDANRDRLVTGDPDLLFAGQVLLLPPAP